MSRVHDGNEQRGACGQAARGMRYALARQTAREVLGEIGDELRVEEIHGAHAAAGRSG